MSSPIYSSQKKEDRRKSYSDTTRPSKETPSHLLLYKTQICRAYTKHGKCRYSSKCQFAHGQSELRDATHHPKFRTAKCKFFYETGICPFGESCAFLHGSETKQRSKSHETDTTQENLLPRSFFDDPVYEPSKTKRRNSDNYAKPASLINIGTSSDWSKKNETLDMHSRRSSAILDDYRQDKSEHYQLFPETFKFQESIWSPIGQSGVSISLKYPSSSEIRES